MICNLVYIIYSDNDTENVFVSFASGRNLSCILNGSKPYPQSVVYVASTFSCVCNQRGCTFFYVWKMLSVGTVDVIRNDVYCVYVLYDPG